MYIHSVLDLYVYQEGLGYRPDLTPDTKLVCNSRTSTVCVPLVEHIFSCLFTYTVYETWAQDACTCTCIMILYHVCPCMYM